MTVERTRLVIDGREATDLDQERIELEVSETISAASVFRLRLPAATAADGTWPRLDDDRCQVWRRLSLEVAFGTTTELLFDGYMTHVDVDLDTHGDGFVELSGMDRSVQLQLEDRQRAWPGKTDEQIARTIFESYGLRAVTASTDTVANEKAYTTLQSDTDVRFLRRLALRNGFECFVRGDTGYFRPPNLQDPPQPVLALAFGGETNLRKAILAVDGTAPTTIRASRLDPHAGTPETEQLTTTPRRHLGRETLADVPRPVPLASTVVRRDPAPAHAELVARLRSAYDAADRFVSLDGEIDGRSYEAVLRPGQLVTVKGLGQRHSGLYYVTAVHHRFSIEGYTQRFDAWRNGIGLTGEESFTAVGTANAMGRGAR